ncbi:MAG: diacylglycerol/lipid kinase family protein [Pseudomonadota bacterium]
MSAMTYWLVTNPKAGGAERGRAFWLEHLAEAGITNPECCDFEQQGWTEKIGADDVVIVAGGDGSVNQGARLCRQKGATLAVLPSGTANDFARNLGLPEQPEALCELIASGVSQQVDVADYGDGIFLNVAHIGAGTLPVRESRGNEKRLFGRFSYAIKLMRRVKAKRGFRAAIRCDQDFMKGRWLSIAVANGAYFGGGSEVPEASADDGQLDVIAVRPRSLVQLLMAFLMLRFNRHSPGRTDTIVHLKGTSCSVHTGKPKTITADGDVIGETPLDVTCLPASLSVIGKEVVSTGTRDFSVPGT